jgi:hypothetical protein
MAEVSDLRQLVTSCTRISCSWLRRYQPHAAIGKRVATSSIHDGIAPGRFTGKDFTGGVVSDWDVEVL